MCVCIPATHAHVKWYSLYTVALTEDNEMVSLVRAGARVVYIHLSIAKTLDYYGTRLWDTTLIYSTCTSATHTSIKCMEEIELTLVS